MENAPVTGLDELDKHLDDLLQDPDLAVNPKLFDDVELQLTETNIPPLIPHFLPRLTAVLKQYTQDPAVIVGLTIKLLGPVSFDQVLQLASPDELVQALDSPAPAANLLALAILHKAAARPQDVTTLCSIPHLLAAFIRRWLAAPQVEVGQRGGKVLGDLLDIDCDLPPPPPPTRPVDPLHTNISLRKAPGQGSLWRLLLTDDTMYALLLSLVSGRHPDTASSPHQLSLAQGRLLRILPRLAAINFRAVAHSHHTPPAPVHLTNGSGDDQSSSNGNTTPPRPGEGLLQYAALHMVHKSDVLMHLSLVDFFETLVSLLRVTEPSPLKVETLRALLARATTADEVLKEALLTLPDRTVDEEADDLRSWLGEVMPGEAVRLAVR
ncbi:hypothetical protein NEMBOFW57_007834 [Staphylotrichum longicolle]|uniref:DNA mismatch repair protein HSM3 N-terminal domain-containing protein n=1 Tax=Staphylotrichum longicolle TaxID=669026 RepID=A0AAD4I0T1_9PEZI|nr:hypothetical protein NEMBOFW57_007834 [Staphylotrichum longicolle]